MKLVRLPMAGGAGRPVIINAEQVVCVVEAGDKRAQLVTTGLSGEASITLMVELSADEVMARLEAAVAQAAPDMAPGFPVHGKDGAPAASRARA